MGPSGLYFGPMGIFWGSRSGSKTLLEPTNVDDQFLFWKYSPIFLYLILPHFGPLLHFPLSFGAIFWITIRLKTHFWSLLILVLEVKTYLFVSDLAIFGAFSALFGFFGAIFGLR